MDDTDARIEAFPVEFSGAGGEFFRVWIVNVLLNIVTLGFYTPFARRRTAQYFYGHTLVAGSPLEFTAPQRKMVIGFLLLVGLYVAFKLAANTGQDGVVAIFMFAAAALSPYFWGSAMRFRMSAMRWRGVRPQFIARWSEVYRASWPLFAIAGAGTAVAVLLGMDEGGWRLKALAFCAALVAAFLCLIRLEFNYKALLVSHTFIGGEAGRWKPLYREFVAIWIATLAIFIAAVLAIGVTIGVLAGGSVAMLTGMKSGSTVAILAVIAGAFASIFLLFLASGPARAYREARMFRLVWNNVGVSRIGRFKCNLRVRSYVLLRVKNILLTLLTMGFYRPFARVSEYRMKTASVTLHVKGSLNQLVGKIVKQQDGVGDAIADAVGLDLVG